MAPLVRGTCEMDIAIVPNPCDWLHMHQLPTLFSPSVESGYHSLRCEFGWILPIGPSLSKEFLYTLGFDVGPNEFCQIFPLFHCCSPFLLGTSPRLPTRGLLLSLRQNSKGQPSPISEENWPSVSHSPTSYWLQLRWSSDGRWNVDD
jgi:hypothetical protein